LILRDLAILGARVVVVARSPASKRRAREQDATDVVDAIEALPALDGVVVATPSAAHADTIEMLLPLGVPIFVEKPITADRASAERVAALAANRLFVMDKWRYHPGVEALGELARSGELGAVTGLRTRRVGWGTSHTDVDPIWTLAPHDLAIALEILGCVPPARSAVAELVGGQATGMVAVLGERPWLTLDISASAHTHSRSVQLVCEDGTAWLADGYAHEICVVRGAALDGEPERRSISTQMPLLAELRAFVQHLSGGPAPRSSAAEGAEVVARIADLRALAGLGAGRREPAIVL
jgi:predicted dehydrogenase